MPSLSAASVSVIVRPLLSLCAGVSAIIVNRTLRKVLTVDVALPSASRLYLPAILKG
jgi:hypothetical protein